MKTTLAIITAVGMAAAAPALASTNLLTNGGFEDPAGSQRTQITSDFIPGWTYSVTTDSYTSMNDAYDIYEDDGEGDGLTAADGTHYVSFGHNGTAGGSLFQSFATVVGDTYTVNLYVAEQQGDDSGQQFTVCAGPTSDACASSHVYSNLTSTFVGQSFTLVAADTATGLRITDSTTDGGGGANLALDKLSVTLGASAVPEPAAWSLMLTGFGLAGSALRRRRAATLSA